MADQKERLAAYYQWQHGMTYDKAALDDFFEQKRRKLDLNTASYQSCGDDEMPMYVAVDVNGDSILNEAGNPEVCVDSPGIWNTFSQDTIRYAANEGGKLAEALPVFVKLFCDPEGEMQTHRTNVRRLLQEVTLGQQKAVNCLTVMSLATTEILYASDVGPKSTGPLPLRVQSLIEAARDMYADWLASQDTPNSFPSVTATNSILTQSASVGKVTNPACTGPKTAEAATYNIGTSQELDALERAASDGRTGKNYKTDVKAGFRTHSVAGLSHYVRLMQMPEEIANGVGIDALERLTSAQDADCIFTLLYVSGALIPDTPLQSGYAGGWISLDNVMEKIGWLPRSTKEREEMRGRVWQYLLFGARANVIGRRSTLYKDPSGNEIPTQIETPLWSFISKEKPIQPNLFPEQEVPIRVEIVISKQWENLMTNPRTAQYLPMGELLGTIPGDKAGGAWARTMGLSLSSFWRRNPRETLKSTLLPTRAELLTRFLPKKAAPEEVLKGENPRRALEYWHSALQELTNREFLARSGEAARTLEDMKNNLPRYKWQEDWLKESVDLMPGPKMAEHVKRCAESLPTIKPKALDAPRKRGRPRKTPTGN